MGEKLRTMNRCATCKRFLKANVFLFCLLVGIACGVGLGIGLRARYPDKAADKRWQMYIAFPGELLLRMLKMVIVPLIVASLVSGMAAVPSQAAGRMGAAAVAYYMITTVMAVLLGILLVSTIRPGDRSVVKQSAAGRKLRKPVDALLDLVRNAFPDNIVGAALQKTGTEYESRQIMVNETQQIMVNGTIVGNETTLVAKEVTEFKVGHVGGMNILGLVVFSVVLGVIIGRMGAPGRPLKIFFDSLQAAIIKIIRIIIWYSPIGIAFIIAGQIVKMDKPEEDFYQLLWYMMTVLIGLAIHEFVVLTLIYVAFTRKNPFRLMLSVSQALLTALGTASSSATLPVTLKCLQEKAKIDRRVCSFVVPVGTTINMDGTALYEAVAAIFIAQVKNFDLDAGQIITISITATAAAIGAAGIPEGGLFTMMIVLSSVGLPTEDIGLILAVDWLLDRFRTQVNVWGDSVGAGVVEKLCEGTLRKLREDDDRLSAPELRYPDGSVNLAIDYDDDTSRENNITSL